MPVVKQGRCLANFIPSQSKIQICILLSFPVLFGAVIGICLALTPVVEESFRCSSLITGVLFACAPGGLTFGVSVAIVFRLYQKPKLLAVAVISAGLYLILFGLMSAIKLNGPGVINFNNSVDLCVESFSNSTRTLKPLQVSGYPNVGALIIVAVSLLITGATAGLPCVVAVEQHTVKSEKLIFLLCVGVFLGLLLISGNEMDTKSHISYIFGSLGSIMCASVLALWLVPKQNQPGPSITETRTQNLLPRFILKDVFRNSVKNWTRFGFWTVFTLDMLCTASYLLILPRYLQTQFDVSFGISNTITALGFFAPLGAGAEIVSRAALYFQFTRSRQQLLSIACVFLSCLGFIFLIFMGCAAAKFDHELVAKSSRQLTITNICNSKCDCLKVGQSLRPVCHEETGVTFASACHAGCLTWNSRHDNCECVRNKARNDQLPPETTHVVDGFCPRNCDLAFFAFVFIGFLTQFHAGFPLSNYFKTVSVFTAAQKSLSIAPGAHLTALLLISCSLLPASLLTGAFLDSTCILWDSKISETFSPSRCILYNANSLRAPFHTFLMLSKLTFGCGHLLLYHFAKNNFAEVKHSALESVHYQPVSAVSTSTVNLLAEEGN